ncbi:SusE domain-containing protein [Hymenobacter psoromatis]|uniref:SusE domain-containing protein n=1 Tax=Hymenobacter psoromatis TaxID=1484116 RepID=UPI001CBEB429|nr:SusE domain-containing protein [Hymenobacter psoromatis]
MQSWFIKTTVGAGTLALLALAACKKDEVRATLTPASTPTLTASTSAVVLSSANAAQGAVIFTWTPISGFNWTNVEHPYDPAVTYMLQFAKKGSNFAAPFNISAGAGPNTTLNVADFDAAILAAGIAPNVTTDLEVRLQSAYASNQPLYTASLPLTVTPYPACQQPAKAWGIVGPAGPGWPGGAIDFTMTYDCAAQTYTYTGPLKADQFKFRFGKEWATNLGGKGPNVPLAPGGDNLVVATPGTYTVVLFAATDTTNLAKAYYTIK